MGRVLTVLAAVAVAAGCGTASKSAQTGAGSGAAGAGADDVAPYPVVWSKSLPDESALEVTALHIDPVTGDVVLAATLRSDVRMAGAVLERQGYHDGVVARFDSEDGVQLWVTAIAATDRMSLLGVGSDAEGDTLMVGECRGELLAVNAPRLGLGAPFVIELDRNTGAIEFLGDFGSTGSNSILAGGDELLAAYQARKPASANFQKLAQMAGLVLPDGGIVLARNGGLLVREPDMTTRWQRSDLGPMSAALDGAGRLLVAGRMKTRHSPSRL